MIAFRSPDVAIADTLYCRRRYFASLMLSLSLTLIFQFVSVIFLPPLFISWLSP